MVVLLICGFAFKDRIAEEYWLWKLESENLKQKKAARIAGSTDSLLTCAQAAPGSAKARAVRRWAATPDGGRELVERILDEFVRSETRHVTANLTRTALAHFSWADGEPPSAVRWAIRTPDGTNCISARRPATPQLRWLYRLLDEVAGRDFRVGLLPDHLVTVVAHEDLIDLPGFLFVRQSGIVASIMVVGEQPIGWNPWLAINATDADPRVAQPATAALKRFCDWEARRTRILRP